MDKRIGAQLFTVREHTQTLEGFETSLKKIAEIGYKAVQLSCIGNFAPEDIKALCDKYNLVPICTHRSWEEYCDNLQYSIDFHKTIGCNIAGIGAIPKLREGFTWDDVPPFVAKMNEINAKFKDHGITFAYHNHDAEFHKFDGKRPIDYIIEHGEFDFIIDIYWLAAAGVDPARFIKKLGKRAKVVHYKDIAVINGGKGQCIAEVMDGNLDWDSVVQACESAGVQWAVVEMDTCPGDPFDSLKNCYENLKTKGFV